MRIEKYEDPDRIYEEETISGTAISYTITSDGVAHYPIDYELCSLGESFPGEMRACAKDGDQRGASGDSKLQGELVVLFGPKLSAKGAAELLTQLGEKIAREGLAIGRDEDGGFVYEMADGRTISR
jgi:hypothetical protein